MAPLLDHYSHYEIMRVGTGGIVADEARRATTPVGWIRGKVGWIDCSYCRIHKPECVWVG